MGRHFARPHLGKTPLKYYFRADNIEVSLPGIDVSGKLVVTWKRGHRKTSTDAFAVREELSNIDGSISRTATTLEDLCIICTMFKTRRHTGRTMHACAHAPMRASRVAQRLDGAKAGELLD